MKKDSWYKKTLRKIFGKNIYQDVHALKVFQPMTEPFPSQPSPAEDIRWDQALSKADRNAYKPLVYIVSPMQRSGTNFLNYMLRKHPGLYVPNGKSWPDEQCLFTAAPEIASYVSRTVGYWTNWVKDHSIREKKARAMFASMGDGCLAEFGREAGENQLLLFKTPDTGNIEWAYHMFPNIRLVVLVRDGRDTIMSYINSWGGRSIFRRLCKRWDERSRRLLDLYSFVRKNKLEDQFCFVRYEDLLADKEFQLRRIITFAGLSEDDYPWHDLENVPVLGSSSFKKNDKVHWKPVKNPKKFNPTGRWRDWTRYEKSVFKRYAGETLIKFEYEASSDW